MVKESAPPSITGISPAEGPAGTVVKIRGENLGTSRYDIMGVFICNANCTYTVEWKSSRLIHARTGPGLGMGDIIVFTKSGGKGTSLVKFRGFTPRVGLLTEAAVWVDESKLFEEKPSATLSTTRVLSPNAAYVDPLGVAPEETGAILPADQIEEWYPGRSSNPLYENFDPSRFLLERHLDTGFDALKSGYYHLQSQDTRTSVGPASFVRGNLSTILGALHTLNDVQKSMITHESESIGGNICEELQGVLQSCVLASNLLFKDILTRKDNCDVKRNVLNVLHRYRFLFNLPRSIEKNIQQGEYEILISDYNRAKALFQNTEVKSFQKALAEVDQKITAFRKKLKQKLFDFPTPVEEQKKIIRYLNELDYPGNAGWECITKQTLWFKSMLLDCQVEHQMNESNNKLNTPPPELNLRPSEASYTVPGHKRTPSEPSNAGFSRTHSRTASLPESLRKMHGEPTRTPEGILMVEDLCKLISDNLSDLWHLGQTYLSNQLGDKKHDASHVNEERAKFQSLVEDVIVVFCEMVQTVLHPDETGRLTPSKERELRILVPWYPDAVKSVRAMLERLIKLGLTEEVLSPLRKLTTDCICDCVKKVLSSAAEEVKDLYRQEFWELEYDRRGSYWISKLPSKFEKLFADTIQFVHDFLTDSKLDKSENKAIHQQVVHLLGTMLEAFLLTLERSVYPEDLSDSNEEQDGPEDMQQVIVLLSNCHHVREAVMPHVITQCVRYGYEEIQELNEEITIAITKLDERVFSTYVEKKGDPLVGSIELGMNMAEYNWNGTQPVEGVRAYMKDLLMGLVYIHDQISSVSTIFNKRIFAALIDRVVEEYQRVYACVDKFSDNGSLQAHIELTALRSALELYISEEATAIIDDVIERLPTLDAKHKTRLDEMLSSFKESMRYQLGTFGPAEQQVPPDPKETSMSKLRSKSIEALDQEHSRTSSISKESRGRKKSRSKSKQSWSAEVQVEKTDAQKKTLLTLSEKPDEHAPTSQGGGKKTKRKAPPPPSVLASQANVVKLDPTNPFFDDEDEV